MEVKLAVSDSPTTIIDTSEGGASTAVTEDVEVNLPRSLGNPSGSLINEKLQKLNKALNKIQQEYIEALKGAEHENSLAKAFESEDDLSPYAETFGRLGIAAKISVIMNLLNISPKALNVECAPLPPPSSKRNQDEGSEGLEPMIFRKSEAWQFADDEPPIHNGWSVTIFSFHEYGRIIQDLPRLPAINIPLPDVGQVKEDENATTDNFANYGYASFLKHITKLLAQRDELALAELKTILQPQQSEMPDKKGAYELNDYIKGQRLRLVCGDYFNKLSGRAYVIQERLNNIPMSETLDGLVAEAQNISFHEGNLWGSAYAKLVDEMREFFGSTSIIPRVNEIMKLMEEIVAMPKISERDNLEEKEMGDFLKKLETAQTKISQLGIRLP